MEILSLSFQAITAAGIILAIISYLFNRKTEKAKFVFELHKYYNSNIKYVEMYNDLEWSSNKEINWTEKYKLEAEGFFAFFDYIVLLYNKKILKQDDFKIYDYMLKRILNNNQISEYFVFLKNFAESQGIIFPYENLLKYKEKKL